jgi:dGTPase
MADRIAYLNHDLDDSFRSQVLDLTDVPTQVTAVLGRTHGERITTMVEDVVAGSWEQPEVAMSGPVHAAHLVLRDFLFQRVYLRPEAASQRDRAVHCLRSLVVFYLENETRLPAEYSHDDEALVVRVLDFVSGMTDRYALRQFGSLFLPFAFPGGD